MVTAARPGSSGSPGSLPLRPRIWGRCLLTLVSCRNWISPRRRRRQLSPSTVLCGRGRPGRLRKSQRFWRHSQSIPYGHELAFQKRSSPSRGAGLANSRRCPGESWVIRRWQIPNGAACHGWRSIWKRRSSASPSRRRVGAEGWICNFAPRQSRSGCSWSSGTSLQAPAGGAQKVTLATESHPWHWLQESQKLH